MLCYCNASDALELFASPTLELFDSFLGVSGPDGPTGDAGTDGEIGFTGGIGPSGPAGDDGPTGPIGFTGKYSNVTSVGQYELFSNTTGKMLVIVVLEKLK